jgi:hypothetical protein
MSKFSALLAQVTSTCQPPLTPLDPAALFCEWRLVCSVAAPGRVS